MPEIAIIFQCELCRRYFSGEGADRCLAQIMDRRFVPELIECGYGDCGEVVARNAQIDLARRQRTQARFAVARGAGKPRAAFPPTPAHRPGYRLPYADSDDDKEEKAVEGNRTPKPGGSSDAPSQMTAKEFGEREFEASGASDTADLRLWEFFFESGDPPKVKMDRFNKWYRSAELEDFLQTSRRMNNRAITFRERCRPLGLELDNRMSRPGGDATGPVCSQYRLCTIDHAIHLSDAEKQKILAALPR